MNKGLAANHRSVLLVADSMFEQVTVTREVQMGEDQRRVFNDVFLKHVRAVSERALKQFTRPEGIDPAWSVESSLSFRYVTY